ncbi:hypothetical protein LPB67_05675 [Undibacterium sp. Jales W-56]|uniref:hypothetical protein n=1 Tax=Undibacterium sp. Jales W-56 TaxID=2897325 RepID=UPI0021D3E1AD|nr:hypothetical protein [Undibacterium sp. Jales W-56]MCU6433266.1 hypothetical protein [Undibacterium sp. Jales W-56]
MRISFTKLNGKHDHMTVWRGDVAETIQCPKQRIIPHDMVHFAVESTLHKRGFLARVVAGEAADFQMDAEPESDSVERLVEVFQGDAWSGGDSRPEDMLDLYRVTCQARDCEALPVSCQDVVAVRDCIASLDAQWQALPAGQSMELEL